MAEKTEVNTKAKADERVAKTDVAMKAYMDLNMKLEEESTSPQGARALILAPERSVSLALECLDKSIRLTA